MFDKKTVYSLLLFFLIGCKISLATLHVYETHLCKEHDHQDHCDDCDTFLSLQLDEFSSTTAIQLTTEKSSISNYPVETAYRSVAAESNYTYSLSIRPPPSRICSTIDIDR